MSTADTITVSVLLLANLAAFAAFGWDKRRARRGGRRIPESRLILLGFALGFGGAWAGVYHFRHKTRKAWFRARLALVTVVNPTWLLLWLRFR